MTITLANLRKELMRATGIGSTGNTTSGAGGAGSALIDATLLDVYSDVEALNFVWIYRANAAAADQLRRVNASGFTISTGQLTPSRAWAVQPSGVEAYELCPLMPAIDHSAYPYSLLRAINDGLGRCYFRDLIALGRGDDDSGRRFRLDASESGYIAAILSESAAVVTPPTGWATITTITSGLLNLATYFKRADKGDPTTWTWTFAGSTAAAGAIMAIGNARLVSPTVATLANASSATVTAPSVTSIFANSFILRVLGTGTPTPFTQDRLQELFDLITEQGDDAGSGLWLGGVEQAKAGASGTATATMNNAAVSVAQSIELAPSPPTSRVVLGAVTSALHQGPLNTTIILARPSGIPSDDWTPNPDAIRRVFSRSLPENPSALDQDESKNGRYWRRAYDPPGIELGRVPSTEEVILAEVVRPYPPLSAETEATDCPTELAVAAASYALYMHLDGGPNSRGAYKTQLASAQAEFARLLSEHRIPSSVEL